MKKIIFILFILSMGLMLKTNKEEKIIIPQEAIRYRIIANSNSFKDQEQKYLINASVEPVLENIINNSSSLNDTRVNINNNIPNIKRIVNNYNVPYKINYGLNYFPEKEYKGLVYPEGDYESLVITLGDGLGDNWWCVLFPPLCLLEAKESDLQNAEYTFYIKDIINKFS